VKRTGFIALAAALFAITAFANDVLDLLQKVPPLFDRGGEKSVGRQDEPPATSPARPSAAPSPAPAKAPAPAHGTGAREPGAESSASGDSGDVPGARPEAGPLFLSHRTGIGYSRAPAIGNRFGKRSLGCWGAELQLVPRYKQRICQRIEVGYSGELYCEVFPGSEATECVPPEDYDCRKDPGDIGPLECRDEKSRWRSLEGKIKRVHRPSRETFYPRNHSD
jgi:hypothetical protein